MNKMFHGIFQGAPQRRGSLVKRLSFVSLTEVHLMKAFSFERSNNALGWLVFGIALLTYALTLEPTVSFWDCGEYIATGSNLEVGHPPGASTFQMIAALFSSLNLGDVRQTARAVNLMSALSSAFAILFLFWSITAIARKSLSDSDGAISRAAQWAILGSGLVGALTFAFSDTFWFSAVEGEVYAMNSLFNALVFWLILKWEARAQEPRNERWLLLIALLLGLSFGVHLMVLLAIPTLVTIYYMKRFRTAGLKDFILLNAATLTLLGIVLKVIFPYSLRFFGACELFFVNSIGLPFHSGTLIALALYSAFFYSTLRYTRKKHLPHLNTALLFCLFLLIGTLSWVMIAIRANTNTPINENNPDTAVGLLRYYNREQYGDWPVFYGPLYTAYEGGLKLDAGKPYKDAAPKHEKDEKMGRYEVVDDGKYAKLNFDPAYTGPFARLYSQEPGVIQNYKTLEGPVKGTRPSLWKNIHYFLNFQVGYMYLRYLMWNFAGRQNDAQGHGDLLHGNWKSGIHFIDAWRLGPQTALPSSLAHNKGSNAYYFLPLLLGLIGMCYSLKRDPKAFYALLLFFLLTGVGIVVYTNIKPYEPRERDYAYVNSFYVFAIWVGLGVLGLYRSLKDRVKGRAKAVAVLTTLLCLLASPALMAYQNWDDHDRSNRYTARDMSENYLKTADENAIFFTHGDNDTFPLWYLQEVEHFRTDVKVVNLSLLNTNWYIDQQKRKTWDAAPIPGRLKHPDYAGSKLNVLYYLPRPHIPDTLNVRDFINWVKSPKTWVANPGKPGKKLANYPCRYIAIPVDRQKVIDNGVVEAEDRDKISDTLYLKLPESAIYKNALVIFDMLADNDWKRPIYFSTGGGSDPQSYAFLQDYFQLEGLAYKLVPIKTGRASLGFGRVAADTMYRKVMGFQFGNMEDPKVYHGEVNRNLAYTVRLNFARLAQALIEQEESDKAEKILDLILKKTPYDIFESSTLLIPIIEGYYKLGKKRKVKTVAVQYGKTLRDELTYFSRFPESLRLGLIGDISKAVREYLLLKESVGAYDEQLSRQMEAETDGLIDRFPWLFKGEKGSNTISPYSPPETEKPSGK